jgi:hypothetical protein
LQVCLLQPWKEPSTYPKEPWGTGVMVYLVTRDLVNPEVNIRVPCDIMRNNGPCIHSRIQTHGFLNHPHSPTLDVNPEDWGI